MTDMLVRLYDLPELDTVIRSQAEKGIIIRRGLAPEKHIVLDWITNHFGLHWRSECDVTFSNTPVSCFVATKNNTLLGFACYDATRRGIFGPTGVQDDARGQGVGKALLLACLHDMWMQGYGYAAIGGVGPVEFYQKAVGATVIEDSTPGIYFDMLRGE
ncbi:MAG: N-acetyltransferase [Chloroflexi bacterium]|nr:MAG: GNAT family N-acetyltransferase [Phototrophicales bacterium]RMF80771.1 MAG: N-acetyltransferase [Chloroflexota bacterium]